MSAINWFEIPTGNLERAERFYSSVLDQPLRRETLGGAPMGVFSHDPAGSVGGCLLVDPKRKPSGDGALVYLAVKNVDTALGKVSAAGGSVITTRTSVGEHGFIGVIRDTEGNTVGLHSKE